MCKSNGILNGGRCDRIMKVELAICSDRFLTCKRRVNASAPLVNVDQTDGVELTWEQAGSVTCPLKVSGYTVLGKFASFFSLASSAWIAIFTLARVSCCRG